MLTEAYFAAVCGPPIANNTAVAKDVGIYEHCLHPSHATLTTFKKSSVPHNGLAVSPSHVFAAQEEKSTVHVYSRAKGNQEALVPFPERIRSVALVGDVLFMGTQEGRLIIWEVCTGRQVSTPACHVQAVTCIATTPFHIITGSDDSNLHVWTLPRLLELDSTVEHEPDRTLSNHRAAITSLVAGASANPDTNLCVSASRDKTCVVWNYQTGAALRTLLLPTPALALCLDPCARALFAACEDGSMYAVDLLSSGQDGSQAATALVGPQSTEDSGIPVQLTEAFGAVPPEAGAASCLAVSYDGTVLVSGHPRGQIRRWDVGSKQDSVELANLNAAVTNLVPVSPLPTPLPTCAAAVVKPFLGSRSYNFTAELTTDLGRGDEGEEDERSSFSRRLHSRGVADEALEQAILAFQQPASDESNEGAGDEKLKKENEELRAIIREQRELQKKTVKRYTDTKTARS